MPRVKQPQLEAFATLSGDYNPVHLDSEFAKASYFGTQIVYGIYQVFYALNHALKSCKQPHTLESIQASFHAPLFINTPFSLKVEKCLETTRQNSKDISAFTKPQYDKGLESSDIQAVGLKQAKPQGEVSCDDFRGFAKETLRESRHSKICDEKLPQRDSANEAHLGVRRSEAEARRGDLSRKAECQKSAEKPTRFIGGGGGANPLLPSLLQRNMRE